MDEAILFIAGWTSDHTFWYPFLPHFRDYRCIIFDNRGAGATTYPKGDEINFDDLVGDAAALVEGLIPGKRVHLFGISMGGMIAQRLALERPELCEKLILLSSAARVPRWGRFLLDALLRLKRSGPEEVFVDVVLARIFAGKSWEHPKLLEFVEKSRRYMLERPQTPEGCEAQVRAILTHDTRDVLPKLTIPTLVVAGSEDILTPLDLSLELHDSIPGSRLLVLPSEGHCPVEFSWLERVRDFLAGSF
ncbi:MAG: alpha/beta fold hydrolase [Promethearchaeota archaeon]